MATKTKTKTAEKAVPSYKPEKPIDLIDKIVLVYKEDKKTKLSLIVAGSKYKKNTKGYLVILKCGAAIKGSTHSKEVFEMFNKLHKYCKKASSKENAFNILLEAAENNPCIGIRFITIPVYPSRADHEYVRKKIFDIDDED